MQQQSNTVWTKSNNMAGMCVAIYHIKSTDGKNLAEIVYSKNIKDRYRTYLINNSLSQLFVESTVCQVAVILSTIVLLLATWQWHD